MGSLTLSEELMIGGMEGRLGWEEERNQELGMVYKIKRIVFFSKIKE